MLSLFSTIQTAIIVLIGFFFIRGTEVIQVYLQKFMMTTSSTSRSIGWHERALSTPHPSPSTYTPTLVSLDFAVLHSTPVQPEGFTVAVFKPGVEVDAVAIDAMGRVLLLNPTDYHDLSNLAQAVANDLPTTGKYRNTWMIKQPMTSRPIERVLVRLGDEKTRAEEQAKLKEIGVQGYEEGKRQLKEPVGDVTEIPEALYDFLGLVLEAREGYERGKESAMVQKVKDIVDAGQTG